MYCFIPSLSGGVGFSGSSGRSWGRGKVAAAKSVMARLCVNGGISDHQC